MSEDLARFKGILATIALQSPDLGVREALVAALSVEERLQLELPELIKEAIPTPDDDTDVEIAAAWCRRQPTIVDFMRAGGKKIHAIKEARALSGMGLRVAKEAVEYMEAHLL